MEITEITGLLVGLLGGVAALLTAIAAIRGSMNKKEETKKSTSLELKKLELEGKVTSVELAERLQDMYIELSEKQDTKIRALEEKLEINTVCINKFEKENRDLRTFIRRIFIKLEEGIHELKIKEKTDEHFLQSAEDFLAEIRQEYEIHLKNGDEDEIDKEARNALRAR